MKLGSPMIVVTDMERSLEFYKQVLGLDVILDFGATAQTYKAFIGKEEISFGGDNFELYFEEDDFDSFAEKLKECDVEYVHPVIEHSWGQRVVRFYDPDKHIIEVGENMQAVTRRFLANGMTPEQVAQRMDVPLSYINEQM